MNVILSVIDGSGKDLGQGGLLAVLSILFVFLILSLIVLITWLVFKAIGRASEKRVEAPTAPAAPDEGKVKAELTEDAVVAALIASIDYRNETKKDIKVISIKEIN